MLERVDTRHRWLDILPALGRARPDSVTGLAAWLSVLASKIQTWSHMASASRARRYGTAALVALGVPVFAADMPARPLAPQKSSLWSLTHLCQFDILPASAQPDNARESTCNRSAGGRRHDRKCPVRKPHSRIGTNGRGRQCVQHLPGRGRNTADRNYRPGDDDKEGCQGSAQGVRKPQ
jgi:hypothetical protein